MIIRSKDKVQVIGKNKSVWVLDTNALTVTHNTVDTEPTVTAFRSEHIKYHLHYSAEYRKDRLRKLVNNGEILSYLTELDKAVKMLWKDRLKSGKLTIRNISSHLLLVISAKLKVWRICLSCVRERRCMRIWCMCEESKSVKQ